MYPDTIQWEVHIDNVVFLLKMFTSTRHSPIQNAGLSTSQQYSYKKNNNAMKTKQNKKNPEDHCKIKRLKEKLKGICEP